MKFGNKVLTAIISMSMLNGTSPYSKSTIEKGQRIFDSDGVSQIVDAGEYKLSDSTLNNIEKNVKNQIYLCLETDSPDTFTHTKILESITDPENTVLELPISQLFQKYGNRNHPLAVSGVGRNFRALLGKNGIENLDSIIPQKLAERKDEITSTTKYSVDDTLRFSLIDPLLKKEFSLYLSEQLKEKGFEGFSDTDAEIFDEDFIGYDNLGNYEKPNFTYDVVVKKLSSGKSALALYRNGELFMTTYVSVGLNSSKTKTGQFEIIRKNPYYRSKKYESPMPNGVEFDQGGFWIHQGNVTGYPASHGCVRLPGVFSGVLYSLLKDTQHVDVFISNNLYK